MQFDNQKTRNVADVVAKILAGESAQQEPQMLQEELKGNQHKIDANKNKKIDAHDFKLLRAQKEKEKANSQKFGKDVKEEAEQIDEVGNTSAGQETLKSYAGKVIDDTRTMPQGAKKQKHLTGLTRAMDRIKKEETEQVEEGTYKPEVEKAFPASGVKTGASAPKGTSTMPKDKEKAKGQPAGSLKKEEVGLTESHFKVGDKVKCKSSGMKGEVVKLDKEEGGEDEKYYTVKREDGKMKKMAPNELTKINEETEIDEAMFPGTKEYEKKFGQSPQQKLKKKGDTVPTSQGEMKKTEKGVVHTRRFSEMISAYQEQGLKYIAELSVEEEASQEEYQKEVKKAQNKSEGKEKAEVAKASVEAVKTEQTHTKVQFIDMTDPDNIQKSEIDLEERSLTEPEMKKKEEIVKSMKKGMAGFKQRYGDRAKEVMYATATARAKGE
jgi:hypothetical protein